MHTTHSKAQHKNNPLVLISVAFQPLYVRDWELKVHFKIQGQGKKNLNGDGLAIWLTKDRMQNGGYGDWYDLKGQWVLCLSNEDVSVAQNRE